MPRGRPPELTIERVIWKKHRMDVLRALVRRPAGMRYTEIQYDVVRGSATDTILNELIQVGLAEWKAELYYITAAGKKVASAGDIVAEVGSHSNGNGGVGAR
jgi:hypothetical protein